LEATNTIRDALTTSIDPVYGLTTLHACLRAFHAESLPAFSDEDIKSAVYAFGLIALGKFIMRLPGEIAEEELPRLKGTLISVRSSNHYLDTRNLRSHVLMAVSER
jgi:CLIP-associating protein 1/2